MDCQGRHARKLDALIEQAPEHRAKPEPEEKAPGIEPKAEGYMRGESDLNCNVGNIGLALTKEPEFMNLVGFDEMLRTEVLLRPIEGNDPNFKPRPLTDAGESLKICEV